MDSTVIAAACRFCKTAACPTSIPQTGWIDLLEVAWNSGHLEEKQIYLNMSILHGRLIMLVDER